MNEGVPVRRRRWRRAALAAALLSVGAFIWMWLAFQRIPDWYRPAQLGPDEGDRIRREVTAWADDVSRRIVHRDEFAIEISEGQLNELLAGLSEVVPDARHRWPAWIVDPAVVVDKGSARFAARIQRTYWSVIVNGRLAVTLGEDRSIRLAVSELRLGALPLPDGLARSLAEAMLGSVDPNRASEGIEGLEWRWRNRITWPNGRRDIEITGVELGEGELRVGVRPL